MKLQSPTLILVFVAIALGSFVAVTELRQTPSGDDSESQALFDFEEEEVRSLVVETASRTLKFEKDVPTDNAESDDDSDTSTSDGDTESDGEPEQTADKTDEAADDTSESDSDTSESAASADSASTASASDSPEEDTEDGGSDAERYCGRKPDPGRAESDSGDDLDRSRRPTQD